MVPAPVLGPDGEKYLAFDATYGKMKTTEKDCPSISQGKSKKKENGPRYKLLASRVAHIINCVQCGKPRCIFSMDGSIHPKGQREVDDVIFSCGMVLIATSLYTATHLKCSSPIENSYFSSQAAINLVCYHCGTNEFMKDSYKNKKRHFKTVYPTCITCFAIGKKNFVHSIRRNLLHQP